MTKHYNLTNHARYRMRDRTGIGRKQDIKKEFKLAMQFGQLNRIKDEEFLDYLIERGPGVKVYNGKIFIHNGNTLITVYNVPDRFK